MTFLVMDGCIFSSMNNLIDACGIANVWHPVLNNSADGLLFDTEIVSIDGRPIRAGNNVRIIPDRAISEVCSSDMIFIPGFSEMRYLSEPKIKSTLTWIASQYQLGVPIASTCTGAFILAETGLLDGRVATTNWQFARVFRRRYPKVDLKIDLMLTESDGLICTGAVTAVFNLALHIIRRYGGEDLSSLCSKTILIEPNRGAQTSYQILRSNKSHGDLQILNAQKWMEDHFAQSISIDAVAQHVGISSRNFKRRFRKATGETPLAYLQNVRIQAAKDKLETTEENVNEITYSIGYENSSTFRKLFKREVGLSPKAYRDKFYRTTTVLN